MYTNKPNRLPGFNYASGNYSFVTSVVKKRIPCFGNVINGEMLLNEYGRITLQQLLWLPEQYPYVTIYEHVIMPDHMHGLILINPDGFDGKIKSLSELMGAFKTRSSKFIRLAGMTDFIWQTSFHDRIVRNSAELDRITRYISLNPEKHTTHSKHPQH